MRLINAEALKASMTLDGLAMMLIGKKYELADAMKTVNHAPTIEPERKTGRWIFDRYVWKCSSCGGNPTYGMGYVQSNEELFNFCPHCGARMEVDHEND